MSKERRRRVRAPYALPARLEIVGVTPRGEGQPVTTCDANPWGVRLRSTQSLPPVLRVSVILELQGPQGERLRVMGSVSHNRALEADLWEGGLEFDRPEPQLAATLIELAAYRV